MKSKGGDTFHYHSFSGLPLPCTGKLLRPFFGMEFFLQLGGLK